MKRKDYLVEKLSNEEKTYLKVLITNVRKKSFGINTKVNISSMFSF